MTEENHETPVENEKIKVEVKTGEPQEKSKRNPWIYSTVVLVLILIAMFGLQMTGMITAPDTGTPITAQDQMSAQDAGDKAVSFINENLVQPGSSVILDSIEEMSGVYSITTDYMGNMITVYITLDGKYLMVPGLDMIDIDNFVKPQDPEQPAETEIPKSDRPVLDLFIFSFCPAGTSAEKALVPVGEILSEYADINVKFFSHMHGQYEKEENIRQECIQQEEPEKFWAYLSELLYSGDVTACGSDAECVAAAAGAIMENVGIDASAVNVCIETDGEAIYSAEQQEAGLLGLRYSPSFVINGIYLPSIVRSPEAIKTALCSAFTTEPSVCSVSLEEGSTATTGGCG